MCLPWQSGFSASTPLMGTLHGEVGQRVFESCMRRLKLIEDTEDDTGFCHLKSFDGMNIWNRCRGLTAAGPRLVVLSLGYVISSRTGEPWGYGGVL